jgi:hypothetical protein
MLVLVHVSKYAISSRSLCSRPEPIYFISGRFMFSMPHETTYRIQARRQPAPQTREAICLQNASRSSPNYLMPRPLAPAKARLCLFLSPTRLPGRSAAPWLIFCHDRGLPSDISSLSHTLYAYERPHLYLTLSACCQI